MFGICTKLRPFTGSFHSHQSINSLWLGKKSLSANKLKILIKILALNYAQQSNPHLLPLSTWNSQSPQSPVPVLRHCRCPTVRLSGVKYLKISASVFRPNRPALRLGCLPFYCFTTVGRILWLAKSFALMVIQLSVINGGCSKDSWRGGHRPVVSQSAERNPQQKLQSSI